MGLGAGEQVGTFDFTFINVIVDELKGNVLTVYAVASTFQYSPKSICKILRHDLSNLQPLLRYLLEICRG